MKDDYTKRKGIADSVTACEWIAVGIFVCLFLGALAGMLA